MGPPPRPLWAAWAPVAALLCAAGAPLGLLGAAQQPARPGSSPPGAGRGYELSSRACSPAWPSRRRCRHRPAAPLPPLLPALLPPAAADISRPGGAGHALLFSDHGVVIEGFKDLGERGLEAGLSLPLPHRPAATFWMLLQAPLNVNAF